MERNLHRSHPTIVKLTKHLSDIGLIQKVRQGQGKNFLHGLTSKLS